MHTAKDVWKRWCLLEQYSLRSTNKPSKIAACRTELTLYSEEAFRDYFFTNDNTIGFAFTVVVLTIDAHLIYGNKL